MTRIRTAELLSIGTELTVGETRDTNAGDLAGALWRRGVAVRRMTALPDDLHAVTAAFSDAASRSDLVVSTGGLGPTPDDLTREAIAAMAGEEPVVDPELERWLQALFERRSLPFPVANRKQAWRIPSATAIPNDLGTAPGWWVERPDGAVVVALPGPPREMRPMWDGWVLPRLERRGLGRPLASVTLRLTGIGESAIAAELGPLLDLDARPSVATYARADAVDVRVWAFDDEAGGPGSALPAAEAVAVVERQVLDRLGQYVWGRDGETWPDALRAALQARGWRLAVVEVGLRGALLALLGEGLGDRLALGEVRGGVEAPDGPALEALARDARDRSGCEAGVAVAARPRDGDTTVTIAVATPADVARETRVVFLDGSLGRGRAAATAAAVLVRRLRG